MAADAHRPCHTAYDRWDDEGRYRCGCQVQDPADCQVCETPWPCPKAES